MKSLVFLIALLGGGPSSLASENTFQNGAYRISRSGGYIEDVGALCHRSFNYFHQSNFIESDVIADQDSLVACKLKGRKIFFCNRQATRCRTKNGITSLQVQAGKIVWVSTKKSDERPFEVEFEFVSRKAKLAKFFEHNARFGWDYFDEYDEEECHYGPQDFVMNCDEINENTAESIGLPEISRQSAIKQMTDKCYEAGYNNCVMESLSEPRYLEEMSWPPRGRYRFKGYETRVRVRGEE